jgi:hypothetical protein
VEDGQALFDRLKSLNQQLEEAGVKAFGDLQAADYRKANGEWSVNALMEDIQACIMEMEMQVRTGCKDVTKSQDDNYPLQSLLYVFCMCLTKRPCCLCMPQEEESGKASGATTASDDKRKLGKPDMNVRLD